MKSIAALTTILATTSAFAPTATKQTSSSAIQAFENEVGAQPPLGFWDPLGMLDNADQERFDRLRYVELKHGRIAMLAVAGHTYTMAGNHLSGNIDYSGTSFDSIATGLAGLKSIP
eukprot:CAMPEP_0116052832 /NCGR_PEP_ID=MMETSP0322-20121206/1803_1 /TAXON_ID=163516 /ORGANISM="Leptocylindrus danicus var. apora, Strain B651" /LENGTH=115 /DNA_ID=CAMNT_0003535833 /DNA_START=35 /DNA_END=378 /DNA_ORIENTATION=-